MQLSYTKNFIARSIKRSVLAQSATRQFAHKVVPMPSLSPTMETGSIAKWLITEGSRFEPGVAICEVETDKATVTYEATDEGYIAKILVGTGDVKVGQPLMVTVEEAEEVAQFKNFTIESVSEAPSKPAAPVVPEQTPVPAASQPVSFTAPTSSSSSSRVFASPLAKSLANQMGVDLSTVRGSGPNNRIVAGDVHERAKNPVTAPVAAAPVAKSSAPVASSVATPVAHAAPIASTAAINLPNLPSNIYQDFQIAENFKDVARRLTHAKQVVPHYYLSMELNVAKLLKLRQELNGKDGKLSMLDLIVKSVAKAVQQVPDVNASWFETFVRRYDQVDINVVMGSGDGLVTPVVRDVNGKGLSTLSSELATLESTFLGESTDKDASSLAMGTFTVHNLGMFGIKSAAPIVLPPQACALSLGSVIDTVIPCDNEAGFEVAPIMTVTMSCDHRVVDGAVGAQYLQALKSIVENPITLLL